jgi:hypothetical protein
MKIGSEAHKVLFCRDFIATHLSFEPESLPWPALGEPESSRLRAVPFWHEVLHTEERAGAIVQSFAKTIVDPLLREAIDLQGYEEARHARLIQFLIDHYSIDPAESSTENLPADVERAFIDFGYGECLDAFLGFGAFKIARQSGFLPEAMFAVLDVLMHEETRHIVFFVNWMAYREAQHGRGAEPLRALTSGWYYGRALTRLIGTIRRGAQSDGKDFAATQVKTFLNDFSVRRLLVECLAENHRRMNAFNRQLLRPRLLPTLGHIAFTVMRLLPGGRPQAPRVNEPDASGCSSSTGARRL